VVLQVDRRVPSRTLVQVLVSLHVAGHAHARLLARAGAEIMSAPVALAPELTRDVMLAATDGAPLEVEVTTTEIRLVRGPWRQPLLTLRLDRGIDLRELTAALAQLRSQDRSGRVVVVRVDGGIPVQEVVDVIGAVRATAEGAPLYPDVVLAVGVH
jgi:biopolymer transport protein ExbD